MAWGPIEKTAASRASIRFQAFLKIWGTTRGTTHQSLFSCDFSDSNHRQIHLKLSLSRQLFLFSPGTASFSEIRLGMKKPPSGGFFVPSRSQLNDAAKEELQLDASLYTLLQTLSVSVFEKTQLSCALQLSLAIPETPLDDNQLNFFNF